MRLGRFAIDGTARVGVFEGDSVIDVTDSVDGFAEALETVAGGGDLRAEGDEASLDEIEYLPPTTPENSVFAVALNYRSHIDETDNAVPERPLIFLKLYRSLVGHDEPMVHHTRQTQELDYEAELAAVVGKPAWNVDVDDALEYVAGYTIINDTSARDIQRMGLGDSDVLDWFSAKAMEKTTPVGPHVVTTDELPDPQALHIESRVNGELMQDEGTHLMIRSVAELLSFVSSRVELQPGDLIATGTPEGVGAFQDVRLGDGDTVEITIDGIGTLSNDVEADR